jgi:indole-3-glycerol phosphate synthase
MALPLPDIDRLGGFLAKVCSERLADYANRPYGGAPKAGRDGLFASALRRDGLAIIAEVKRSSPLGSIAALDALATARAYAAGGATALSVLTEPRHFEGSLEDLREIVAGQDLPALRKDFVVHPAMIDEAAEAGASAVLLLVPALKELTGEYLAYTHSLGLDGLVEVHTEREMELAVSVGARIIGINNRDLESLEVNLGTAPRVGQLAREEDFEGVLVALSGYRDRSALLSLEGVFDAVLIGSSLASSRDPAAALRLLLGRA